MQSSTYANRKELFEIRRAAVEEKINALEKTLAMLKFKCWYYEKALADGNEDKINKMMPDKLPAEIQQFMIKHMTTLSVQGGTEGKLITY